MECPWMASAMPSARCTARNTSSSAMSAWTSGSKASWSGKAPIPMTKRNLERLKRMIEDQLEPFVGDDGGVVNELSLDDFRHAIRESYGSECQLVGRERVDEY